MLYRMRIYDAEPNALEAFHRFFNDHLLPIQLRHGARLVGRWQTEDGRVVAIWEYDDRASYDRISARVRADPASEAARRVRESLGPLYVSREEVFMRSTRDLL